MMLYTKRLCSCIVIASAILVVIGLYLTKDNTFKYIMVDFEFTCSPEKRKSLIDSPLPIKVDENVSIDELESSGCFLINKSTTGIWRLIDERNFEKIKCEPTEKHFLGPPRNGTRIALMSLPGSGNTWVRYLLEETTGIYTGSVYRDRRLKSVFPGETTIDNVIVIKTHRMRTIADYDKAILIVRDVFDASLAEYNRRKTKGNHIALTKNSDFNAKAFTELLTRTCQERKYIEAINEFTGDMFVLFYDRLKSDLLNSLTKLAAFCNAEVTLRRLWCTYKNTEGYAHRGQKPDWMSRKSLSDEEMERNIYDGKEALHKAIRNRKFKCSTN